MNALFRLIDTQIKQVLYTDTNVNAFLPKLDAFRKRRESRVCIDGKLVGDFTRRGYIHRI